MEIENIIVTGSNIPLPAGEIPVHTEILDKHFLENKIDGNFIDLFRGLPGIDVSQVGGDGGITLLSLRGGDPNFTAILIDGVKVTDPTNSRGGGFDFSSLDPAMIERVEIVRGAASPLIGSGAVSGVINLITHKATDEALFSAGSRYGTDNSFNLWSGYASPWGETGDFSLTASYSEGGDSVPGNALERLNLNFGAGAEITDNINIRMGAYYSKKDAKNFPEDSGGPRLAVLRELQLRNGDIFSGYVKSAWSVNEKTQLNATYNITRIGETVFSPPIAPGVFNGVPSFTTITNYHRDEMIFNGLYKFSPNVIMNFGGAYLREKGEDSGFVDFGFILPTDFSLIRKTKSLFAEIRVSEFNGCEISASGRLDDADNLDGELNFRAGMECELGENSPTAYIIWGEGFKLPSFAALGNPIVGNSDLRPETSSNVEIGLRHQFFHEKINLDIKYYNNHFTDLIDFDPTIFQNINRDRVRVNGMELSSRITASENFNITMNISYSDSNIIDSDVKLRNRPKWKGSIGTIFKPYDQLTVSLFANIKGNFTESSIVTGNLELSGFTTIDFSAIQKIRESIKVKLSVKNLLNNDYEENPGFPSAGRVALVSLNYIF